MLYGRGSGGGGREGVLYALELMNI